MGFFYRFLIKFLKIVPLAIYVRSALCKLQQPYFGCDSPLCPLAVGGNETEYDCEVTANTAEQLAWCEHAWTPWLNGLLVAAKIPYTATCTESTGFELAKILAGVELFGYAMLWLMPQFGALTLTAYMGFALHFHLRHLKDPLMSLVLQLLLFRTPRARECAQ